MILPVPVRGLKLAQRTGGVLAAADLNELLDIGDFGRHDDGCCLKARCRGESSLSTLASVRITLGLGAAKALT
jgi:hypothetical protein